MKKIIVALFCFVMYNSVSTSASACEWPCFEQRAERVSSDRRKQKQARSNKIQSTYTSGESSGIASYYWQPQRVASGGWFNPNAMTCAHRTARFGTTLTVTNLNNGRSVQCVVNDRGPFVKGRVVDLSRAAAQQIGMVNSGIARVQLSYN